jgi:hypothetical protein
MSVGKEGWRITRPSHKQMRRINWTHPAKVRDFEWRGLSKESLFSQRGEKESSEYSVENNSKRSSELHYIQW